MRRKRLTKRTKAKHLLPLTRLKTGVSPWSRFTRTASGSVDAFAKKIIAGVRSFSYGVAMLFPARTYRAQRRNAKAFADKSADLVGGSVPVLLSATINLVLIATLGTVVIRPAFEPRTDEITATIGKIFEEIPEVEMPADNTNSQSISTAFASASQAVTAVTVSTPAMVVPIMTTASGVSNFQMSASVSTTEASLVADRAAAAASAFAAEQRSGLGRSGGGGGSGYQIGTMKVKGSRLCVILDTSGSMSSVSNQSLKTAQEIARKSGGEVHEHPGCTIRKGAVMPYTDGISFYDIVNNLIRSRNIDAIYWVCDLTDYMHDEIDAIEELKKLLVDRRVRFYVSSYNYKPREELMDLIRATGGDFELKSPYDTE